MFFKSRNAKNINSKIKYIVVGLGNPGERYMDTRHNAGFRAVDYISQKYNFKINQIKFKAFCGRCSIESVENGNEKSTEVLFMKPQTYMNNSGEAVLAAANFYKVPPQNILVISDDVSLPIGKVRIRRSGSDGGQRGLRSIINHLNSDAFPRIKIGIGARANPDYELADWVTSKFTSSEQKIIFESFGRVFEAVDIILKENDFNGAMNRFN